MKLPGATRPPAATDDPARPYGGGGLGFGGASLSALPSLPGFDAVVGAVDPPHPPPP